MLNGMLRALRSGAPWRDLSPDDGAWAKAYSHFRRGREAAVWEQALRELQAQGPPCAPWATLWQVIDGTSIRARLAPPENSD